MDNNKIDDRIDTQSVSCLGKPHKVILFNDENHDQMEVVKQIKKALHCSSAEAFHIMLQAHNSGRSVVWAGGLERCELIASILEDINLGVKIEPV